MAQTKSSEITGTTAAPGLLRVDGASTFSDALTVTGALTLSKTVTVSGIATFNTIKLVQTLGGTDLVSGRWLISTPPALTIGNFFFTFTSGASTFRVPCFPTT